MDAKTQRLIAKIEVERRIAGLAESYRRHADELEQIETEIKQVAEQGICNGTPTWRDAGHSTRSPKLYIVHGVGRACPIHGQPDAGRRIRTYVGCDEERIAKALAAVERHERVETLRERAKRIKARLDRAYQHILSAEHYLS